MNIITQIIINILISFVIYLLISNSIAIIYRTTKFFHFAHAGTLVASPYLTFLISIQLSIPLPFAILIAIVFVTLLGIGMERFIYRPLRERKANSFILLIASLGLYIIIQNLISLIWGDDTKSLLSTEIKVGHELLGGYITSIQIIILIISIILYIGLVLLINKTEFGRQIRAVASNKELARIFGININMVILWTFFIGSLLAASIGILIAFDLDMTPTMGFNLLLYGVVAMIIGGVESTWGLVGGSLLLATAQHLGAYYIDSKWMDAIAYIILILFLIWKPLGFSGKRLKKIEI